MGRSPQISGLKKGPWTPEEDQKLILHIQNHGHGGWKSLPKLAGLNRCGKSCRLRWKNYLRPDIKRGKFSQEEEQIILNLHSVLGNKWSTIASHLSGRTDNEIKNYWNTHLKKKLIHMGIDPMTHLPTTSSADIFSSLPHMIALAGGSTLKHQLMMMENYSSLRLQADQAVQIAAKFQYLQYLLLQPPSSLNNINNPTEFEIIMNHNLMMIINSIFSPLFEYQMITQNYNHNTHETMPFVAKEIMHGGAQSQASSNPNSNNNNPPIWLQLPSSVAPPPQPPPPPHLNNIIIHDGGPYSIWPDPLLLQDDLFHHIPSL